MPRRTGDVTAGDRSDDGSPPELRRAIDELHRSDSPRLIGVRHHSAVLARAVPTMLDAATPDVVMIEWPDDLQDWIVHIADRRTVAPVALSVVAGEGTSFFYPLADFSPELAAVRWAADNDVPVRAIDLAVGSSVEPAAATEDASAIGLPFDWSAAARRRMGTGDDADLWQRLVESVGVGRDAERLRRAALAFGVATRSAAGVVSAHDGAREANMRMHLSREADAGRRVAAVVGAFHAPALTADRIESSRDEDERILDGVRRPEGTGVSLVPYAFDQLDTRSGYPAGVMDPAWHQAVWEAGGDGVAGMTERVDDAAGRTVTALCREIRRRGHVAGTPDAAETLRMMRDLARVRGLPVAGREELVQAIDSCLVRGEPMGRGRVVAAAASEVLVGRRRGTVSPETPRCGLAVAVDEQLDRLRMPGRGASGEVKELRLDVLRDRRDRSRAVLLRRLSVAGVPYGRRVDTGGDDVRENLIERWEVGWRATTDASIEAVSRFGVDPAAAACGVLMVPRSGPSGDVEQDYREPMPSEVIATVETACECGLVDLVQQRLASMGQALVSAAGLSDLVRWATLLMRLNRGHIVGMPIDPEDADPPLLRVWTGTTGGVTADDLMDAAASRLAGMSGSDRPEDAAAAAELTRWFVDGWDVGVNGDAAAGGGRHRRRFTAWCHRTIVDGHPMMRGAATGIESLLGEVDDGVLRRRTGGWIDGATDRDSRRRLRASVTGLAIVVAAAAGCDAGRLDGIDDGVRRLDDDAFLRRLPSLRGGFSVLSPADRRRLLEAQLDGLLDWSSSLDAAATHVAASGIMDDAQVTRRLAMIPAAESAAGRAVQDFFGSIDRPSPLPGRSGAVGVGDGFVDEIDESGVPSRGDPRGDISVADRWRLMLGVPPESSRPRAITAARSLDDLFVDSRGEGSGKSIGPAAASSPRGGREAPEPTSAEWADDLRDLFGSEVFEEVAGDAAAAGRGELVRHLDPETVTPSVELLQQVLSMAGGVAENRLGHLRRLARRITDDLAARLAVRLRPAIGGLATPRATRRPNRRLHLSETVRRNLKHPRLRGDGRRSIVAEELMFRGTSRRQMDWHLTFVVDVSASMSASVVYSALVAAILDGLPALTVRFLTFSTEVVDLSGRVDDPLGLLLDVQIGGGTDIALGIRAAREGLKVPSRSIVLVVTDFEEGCSVGGMLAEVRVLVGTGAKCLGLAALDDGGRARYHQGVAAMVAGCGMPVAAVGPERLAAWIGDQIRGDGSGDPPGV